MSVVLFWHVMKRKWTFLWKITGMSSTLFLRTLDDPARPNQWFVFPWLVNRFQKSTLRTIQYKYLKSCSDDLIVQNLILRTRSYSTDVITQSSWLFHLAGINMIVRKCFCTNQVPATKWQISRAGSWTFLHRVGRAVHEDMMNAHS